MKFSYILTALLATLTVASPIPSSESTEVAHGGKKGHGGGGHGGGGKGGGGKGGHDPEPKIVETAEYKAAKKAMPFYDSFEKDQFYYFTLEWPRGSAPEDAETTQEIEEVRDELGFDHIGIVVGQVTETPSGKGKNAKITKDFKAQRYDMMKKNANPGNTFPRIKNWTPDSKHLKHGGKTKSSKAAPQTVKKHANAYTDAHAIYQARGNNCNDFVEAMIKTL